MLITRPNAFICTPHEMLNISSMANTAIFFLWALLALALLHVEYRLVRAADIFQEWHILADTKAAVMPQIEQPVITINGMFPGPLINATTNDVVYVNVFNEMDEPLLFTWNGIQQRLDSWQDGVSGTNCPILAGQNWTYVSQTKDQIGTFFYFPSINFQKVAGGFGPIRVNNRPVISVPFSKPEEEFDLLIGDWYYQSYKSMRLNSSKFSVPDTVLMNGKLPYGSTDDPATFNVSKGKTYQFRIVNTGNDLSFNFRIQNHGMLVVETEGSYTAQITVDSLDIHVGQSYSVLVTANQAEAKYFIIASPKLMNASETSALFGLGVLNYANSTAPPSFPVPPGPDPFDVDFSVDQARSIRWNMTTGAARPNPQGTFNVHNVTLSQTFILCASTVKIGGTPRYAVNNISYVTPDTPLKLADHLANGTGVYKLDEYPVDSMFSLASSGVFVASGVHKGWIELVFQNNLKAMDSWHLDGFGFFVVGFGKGNWTPSARSSYNTNDPVVRSTVQVYPGRWTAVYAYLDNPGMWNLRSQNARNWYLGQEMYIRVYDADPDPSKERPPPENLLLCGKFKPPAPPSSPAKAAASPSLPSIRYYYIIVCLLVAAL